MTFKSVIVLAFMFSGAAVQAQSFEILGVRSIGVARVGSNSARHSVAIRNCANDLTHVKLIISESGIEVEGAGVTYTDGTVNKYSLYQSYPEGYESSWLNLDPFRSPNRCISSVFVRAHSTDRNTARVEIVGNFR
jgi:hypothetical protein